MLKIADAWSQAEVAEAARGVQAELGWVLHPAAVGTGLAAEAAAELLRVCFEGLGIRRVVAYALLSDEWEAVASTLP